MSCVYEKGGHLVNKNGADGQSRTADLWDTSGQIPGEIKNFLPDSLFKYTDVATWDNKNFLCSFEGFTTGDSDIYKIMGEVKFDGGEEETKIEG